LVFAVTEVGIVKVGFMDLVLRLRESARTHGDGMWTIGWRVGILEGYVKKRFIGYAHIKTLLEDHASLDRRVSRIGPGLEGVWRQRECWRWD
jgi:hypothetical protein